MDNQPLSPNESPQSPEINKKNTEPTSQPTRQNNTVIRPSQDFLNEIQPKGDQPAIPESSMPPKISLQPVLNQAYVANENYTNVAASSLNINTKESFKWGRFIKITGIVVLLVIVVAIIGLYIAGLNTASSLSSYNVSQANPSYSAKFYINSKVSQKNGITYLIYTDSHNNMTALWVDSISSPSSYGSGATFPFALNGVSETGSCNNLKNICVADVQLNGHYYQFNITSQGSVKIVDVKGIFSSISLQ